MKIKSHWIILLGLFFIMLTACDDDLNTVGTNIQPDGDNVTVEADTFQVNAKTIRIDSIFAWTNTALLGNYQDNFFGSIKSDYLSEYYCPENMAFADNVIGIDSVQMHLDFIEFYGDTLAPMGLSVYRVTSPLRSNFYTNMNPADYSDMSQVLGQKTYTISQADKYFETGSTTIVRTIATDLDIELGNEFYQESLKSNNAFQNSSRLKEFFPGTYVTTTFGSGNLIVVESTSLNVFYRYIDYYTEEDEDGEEIQKDSIAAGIFSLAFTPEVIQLNHVENMVPQNLLDDTNSVYMTSPGGVAIELEFPMLDIIDKIGDDKNKAINAANFCLTGFTQKEEAWDNKLGKPEYVLLIEKDSVTDFFQNRRTPNNITSMLMAHNSDRNTYNFFSSITSSGTVNTTDNMGALISEYRKKNITENPKFLIVPVEISISSSVISSVYNYMKPSTSIIRNLPDYMELNIVYSEY